MKASIFLSFPPPCLALPKHDHVCMCVRAITYTFFSGKKCCSVNPCSNFHSRMGYSWSLMLIQSLPVQFVRSTKGKNLGAVSCSVIVEALGWINFYALFCFLSLPVIPKWYYRILLYRYYRNWITALGWLYTMQTKYHVTSVAVLLGHIDVFLYIFFFPSRAASACTHQF